VGEKRLIRCVDEGYYDCNKVVEDSSKLYYEGWITG
jgi:hypothetical protein